MILYIEMTKPVIKAIVKYDMENSGDDVMDVNGSMVKVQGSIARKINDFFNGCAYEIKSVKELRRVL